MKKTLGIIALAATASTGAIAADITPYVGLGVVVDKAGTSAKRVGFNPQLATIINPGAGIVEDAGGDMKFDAAIAGEITAGIKWGHLRGELEFALRSASEDDYTIFSGPMGPITLNASTKTSVKHNSYMANVYYDFEIKNSNWSPYIGAGIGVGTYEQKATVNVSVNGNPIPVDGIKNDKTEFEWQVALGTAYHFTDNWAADIAYRFNSSTIAGEFVYAHELKVGARYSF